MKKYQVRLTDKAEEDVRDIFQWHEIKLTGLGYRFIFSLEAAFASIERVPLGFRKIHKNIRRVLLKRFPYGVFYVVEKEQLVVVAVIHHKRNPTLWKKRKN
ncbi:MAG: type II toxin-antitoxin system RelE/ParE family toxin [Deltaproteobacteria bacterium]|nr:MAG: type II toxin-antitoxin system RelE/ParE family toxin [Deltaproteobacteria bacterium]